MSAVRARTSSRFWVTGIILAAGLALAMPSNAVGQKAEDADQVVFINSVECHPGEAAWGGGILARELVRQAFWLAATDAGLIVRDAALREALPSNLDASQHLTIAVRAIPGRSVKIHIDDKKGKVICDCEFPLGGAEQLAFDVDLTDLIPHAEELSRTVFAEAIRTAGFSAAKPLETASTPLPPHLDGKLDKMSIFDQFAALREIHKTIRKHGRSPALMGGLVRGYANLGELTLFLWNPTPKVFLARSLVCAQRLVATHPDSRSARWSHAYALALAGLHGAALKELDALTEPASTSRPAGGSKGDEADPRWAGLLRLLCEYQTSDLKAAAKEDKDIESLAMYMAFLTIEFSGADEAVCQTARQYLETQPDCLRVYDAMYRVGGVPNLHWVTIAGPRMLGLTVAARRAELLDAAGASSPTTEAERAAKEAKRLLDALESEDADEDPDDIAVELDMGDFSKTCAEVPGVVEALVHGRASSQDSTQPSRVVLGRIIEDILFIQICQRADFMKNQWEVPIHEFIAEVQPLAKHHPYFGFLAIMDMQKGTEPANVVSAYKSVGVADPNYRMALLFKWMLDPFHGPAKQLAHSIWREGTFHADAIASDLCLRISVSQPEKRSSWGETLIVVSPRCPIGYATCVENDWNHAQPFAASWSEQFGHHISFAGAMARKYSALKEYKKAENCLRQYIRKSPDCWAFRLRADNALAQGNERKWRRVLDEFLEQDSPGLEHERVRVTIANHLMANGEYKEALPYAEKAGESWAAWTMECALRCNEGLENWSRAEEWARRLSERYEADSLKWYFWCKRTGHGDLKAATKDAKQRVNSIAGGKASLDQVRQAGAYYVLTKQPKKALDAYDRVFKGSTDYFSGLSVALLADLQGDERKRDQVLKEIGESSVQPSNKNGTAFVGLARLMRDDIASKESHAMTIATIEKVMVPEEPILVANLWFLSGQFFEARHDLENAKECMLRCARNKGTTTMTQTLAVDWLRQRKTDFKVDPPGPAE